MAHYRLAIAAAAFCASLWGTRHGLAWLGFAMLALALGIEAFRTSRRFRATTLVPFAIAIAGGLSIATLRPDAPPLEGGRTATYRAVVVDAGEPQTDGTRTATLRLGGVTLEAIVAASDLPVGAALLARGRVEPPDVARNPGEPSPRDLARERGIDGTLDHARIVSVGDVDRRDATLWLPRLRAWASERLRTHLDEPYASIAAGALLGERGTFPTNLRDEFQETGTTHVLVTAGLHLGVIAALAVLLLELAGCGRISSSLLAIVIVCAYAALSGGHLPAIRAATMATIALLARATGRRALSWNALGAAAAVVVLIRPSSIDSVSFAMSFSCVASIVLFADPLQKLLERLHLPHVAREAVALTIATQLGTWPLTAATFLTIAPFAPLANLFVVPVVGLAMLVGAAIIACPDVPVLVHVLANAETTLLAWIVAVVGTIAAWPGAHLAAAPPPAWTIVVYDLALAGSGVLLRAERRVAAGAIAFAACALCVLAPVAPPGDLRIVVLDVGQADAIVIRTPRGHTFLVDAGGRLERGSGDAGTAKAEAIGERIVVPYLLRQGVHHIDALLMTHPHGDHVCGAPPVLRDLDVSALADSGQVYPGHCYGETMQLARERSLPVLEPRGGAIWQTDDGVVFRFYGPTLPYIVGSRSDINSNSLVFRVEYGSFRMLFTGDAGAETESRMLAAHDDLRADILKVGHHGSAYGTTDRFVIAVSPQIAVISVGRHNLFGHPSPKTLLELARHKIRTFRTDLNGALTIQSDGDAYLVRPYILENGRRARLTPEV